MKLTPYGFYELEYKNSLIIFDPRGEYNPKGYTVKILGDQMCVHSLTEAKKVIDEVVKYYERG